VDSSGSEKGQLDGCCEHCIEPLGSEIVGKFVDCMSDYQLLKYGSVQWSYLILDFVLRGRIRGSSR
jgi:hypothetical protein